MEAPPPATSDADLMRRVVQGDESAFGALYDRYAELVFGAVIRFVGDRQLAEDVVQDTYLALWNRADRFDPEAGSLLGWLLAIARNRAVDRHRAAARRPATISMSAAAQADETDTEALERLMADGSPVASAPIDGDPETALLRDWLGAVVRATLGEMPELERRAIELAYYDGLTQSEIAARLGWPIGTVKTRTRRGLGRLRDALDGVLDEPAAGGDHGSGLAGRVGRAGAAPMDVTGGSDGSR